jgi:hypothetical protein
MKFADGGGKPREAVLTLQMRLKAHFRRLSGRGSAWLERLVRDQEVGGSNPLAPTTLIPKNQAARVTSSFSDF